ncbi:unnamed protein product, partial [Phaeothamnion confervicola]
MQADTSCFDQRGTVFENVSAVFKRSNFTYNEATGDDGGMGGGVVGTWATAGSLQFEDCYFEGNHVCPEYVGGVGRFGGPDVGYPYVNFTVEVRRSKFVSNTAGWTGGVWHMETPKFDFRFSDSTLKSNRAGSHGGVT